LIGGGDDDRGILHVRLGAEREKRAHANLVKFSDELGQPSRRRQRRDVLEVGIERLRAVSFDGLLIHAARVVVADFLGRRVASRRGRFEHAPQDDVVLFRELVKSSPARPIGGNRVGGEPAAARELIEIGTGVDGSVELRRVEPRGCAVGLGCGSGLRT
jgi:hypothetical protein